MNRYLVSLDGSAVATDELSVQRLLAGGTLLWLDLESPDAEAHAMLRDVFGLHPLAVEDVEEFGQRPKLENYGDVSYLVAYGAQGVGDALVEVHCFYSPDFLITIRREPCAVLDQLRSSLGQPGSAVVAGMPSDPRRPVRLILLHHVLDDLVDSFFPPLSDLDDQIDRLQAQIFAKPSNEQLATLLDLQQWLVGLRKLVTPQRDTVASLVSGVTALASMTPEAEPYLRDLYDHLIRISDQVDSYRDLLSNAMDAYLSMVSNRLNEVMKQLTVIATVFLPLSFLTGFFGQNFGWMINHLGGLWPFLALGVGTEILAAAGLFVLFRRRGWA